MSEFHPSDTISHQHTEAEYVANRRQDLELESQMGTEGSQADQDNEGKLDGVNSQNRSQRGRKPWLGLLLFISMLVNGVVLWQMYTSSPKTSPSAATAAKTPPPRPVEVTTLSRGRGIRSVQVLGEVQSRQQSTIRAQTGGLLKQILVQPGDRVAAGQTVAILDDADQKLAIAQAQAQLAQQRNQLARLEVGTRPEIIAQREAAVRSAQAREREAVDNLQRRTELVKQGAIAERLLVEARAAVDDARGERLEAQAELAEAKAGPTREEIAAQRANVAAAIAVVNQAKLASARTQIKAGSTGVVSARKVSPGDYLQDGGEIVTLVAGNRLDIFLELPEQLSGQVRAGTRVELRARALPEWKGNATITGVVPSAEAASRRQRVRVRLDNPPQELLPGMAISGNLQIPENNQGFVVSRDTLTRMQDKWFVFAVDSDKVKQVQVDMIADMGEKVAISGEELQAGQKIVLRGVEGLKDGAKVKVADG